MEDAAVSSPLAGGTICNLAQDGRGKRSRPLPIDDGPDCAFGRGMGLVPQRDRSLARIAAYDYTQGVGPRRAVADTIERFGKPVPESLPTIVRAFKAATTRRINLARGTPASPVWQAGFYERVIRTEKSLERIREYIRYNPLRWSLDAENPDPRP